MEMRYLVMCFPRMSRRDSILPIGTVSEWRDGLKFVSCRSGCTPVITTQRSFICLFINTMHNRAWEGRSAIGATTLTFLQHLSCSKNYTEVPTVLSNVRQPSSQQTLGNDTRRASRWNAPRVAASAAPTPTADATSLTKNYFSWAAAAGEVACTNPCSITFNGIKHNVHHAL
jgi:hypothetical protein